jgi:hypothetical protein
VASYLGLELGKIKIKRFADGEIYVQVQVSYLAQLLLHAGCRLACMQHSAPAIINAAIRTSHSIHMFCVSAAATCASLCVSVPWLVQMAAGPRMPMETLQLAFSRN